jgi:hypothetical protein
MLPYRGFVVWDVSIFVLMGVFLLFVAIGWPGAPNSCLNFDPATQTLFLKDGVYDQCYCEQYTLADILRNAGGVRQPVNTWFNMYSLITSFIVALYIYLDRVAKSTQNVIRSSKFIPDVYIFAVLFLGLGSMWFHASLTESLSWMDGFSMYTFVGFLVFYTIRRLWHADWFFWVFYPITVAAFTLTGQFWKYQLASLILIITLVAVYLAFEVTIWVKTKEVMLGTKKTKWLWSLGVASIGLATLFWALSQTGKPLCDPTSFFQPHGLLWHPLAGVTAVLLYFYWREEQNPVH